MTVAVFQNSRIARRTGQTRPMRYRCQCASAIFRSPQCRVRGLVVRCTRDCFNFRGASDTPDATVGIQPTAFSRLFQPEMKKRTGHIKKYVLVVPVVVIGNSTVLYYSYGY
jgi:hypothetical protein